MIPGFPLHSLPPPAARLLSGLLTADDLNSFWRASLRLLRGCLPHHSCSLLLSIIDYQPSRGRHFVVAQGRRASQPVNSLSISRPFLAAHPKVKLYTFEDVLREDPRAQLRRLEREKLFSGWDDFVHLAFWNADAPEAVLSIRRSKEQGKFRREDRDLLGFLYPIFEAGLRRLRQLEQERSHRQSLEQFIMGLPIAVMFLDEHRQLAFATQEAFDWCAVWNYGYKKARAVNARSSFAVPRDIDSACTSLHVASEHATALGQRGVVTRTVRIKHPVLAGLTARVEISQPEHDAFVRPGFWVTFLSGVNLDGARAELRTEALQHLVHLTPSERRVALLVAEGLRNQQVAQRLGKSTRTVDFQLNTIFRKLEVKSRSELTRLLA